MEMPFLPVLIQFFIVAVKDGQFTVFVITHCSLLEQVRGSETWNRVFWLTTWPAVWGHLTHFGLLVLFPQENIRKSMSDLVTAASSRGHVMVSFHREAKCYRYLHVWPLKWQRETVTTLFILRNTAINGFVKRFLVLINSNSLVWTAQNCITKNAKIPPSETR